MDSSDFMFLLDEDLTGEKSPNSLGVAMNCLKPFRRPIMDLLTTGSTVALFSCGLGLVGGDGLVRSLGRAHNSTRVYLLSSLVYCAIDATLSAFSTKLRDDFPIARVGAAGCCAGLFRSHFLGVRHPSLSSCLQLGLAGIVDHGFDSSLFSQLTNKVSRLTDDAMKTVIVTSTIGSLVGHALILKGRVATSVISKNHVEEFYAISHGLLASAVLLLLSVRDRRNDVIVGGALGCWTSLLVPRSFDGPNDVVGMCLRVGLLFGAAKAIYTNARFFPRMHPVDSGSQHSDLDASHFSSPDTGVPKGLTNHPQNLSQGRKTQFPCLKSAKDSYKLFGMFERINS